jgi:hypothetical protein
MGNWTAVIANGRRDCAVHRDGRAIRRDPRLTALDTGGKIEPFDELSTAEILPLADTLLGDDMTPEEIASEFAEIFDELPTERVNEMLAKNVPFETIEFFSRYAEAFADGAGIVGDARGRLPNLLLFGYLIRVLEERLVTEPLA